MVPCPECGSLLRARAACPHCGATPTGAAWQALQAAAAAAAAVLAATSLGACSSAYGITVFDTAGGRASLYVEPDELSLAPGEVGTVALQSTGPETLELGSLAIEPADLGFALDPADLAALPRALEPGERAEIEVTWLPPDTEPAEATFVADAGRGGLGVVTLRGVAGEGAVTVEIPTLVAPVPCDRAGELRVENHTGRAIVVEVAFPGRDPARWSVEAPEGPVPLGRGEVLPIPIVVRGADVGEALVTVQVGGDDPASHVVASAPVRAEHASRATRSATGEATLTLPPEADPRSALVSVGGALATDVVVDGRTVTVRAPPVGPSDVVSVDYGVLSTCE